MTVGVSMALQLGKKSVACASTGNTSASLAVYAAKAGIPAVVLLPAGKVAVGKVAQALMHGARVISIRGNFDRALEMVHDLCLSHGLYLLNSILSPGRTRPLVLGMTSQEDMIVCSSCRNAGNISAVHDLWFQELSFMDRLQ
jgi:threonine synthase